MRHAAPAMQVLMSAGNTFHGDFLSRTFVNVKMAALLDRWQARPRALRLPPVHAPQMMSSGSWRLSCPP